MTGAIQVASSAVWIWLGMVLAISFLEAPLKFRAPGLELRIGLAIGRIVFRALNTAEIIWALVITVCLTIDPQSVGVTSLAAVVGVVMSTQLVVVRPILNRRTDQVLTGADLPRSSSHHWYILLEATKVVALVALGVVMLAS